MNNCNCKQIIKREYPTNTFSIYKLVYSMCITITFFFKPHCVPCTHIERELTECYALKKQTNILVIAKGIERNCSFPEYVAKFMRQKVIMEISLLILKTKFKLDILSFNRERVLRISAYHYGSR